MALPVYPLSVNPVVKKRIVFLTAATLYALYDTQS